MDLAAFQDVIARTYAERDRARGVPATVAWLAEELGELAQAQDLAARNLPPFSVAEGWQYILGSDTLGRSMIARMMVAAGTTLGGAPVFATVAESLDAGVDVLVEFTSHEVAREHALTAIGRGVGVVIGAGSLVSVLAVGDGVERFARDAVSREGYDLVQVRPITEDSIDVPVYEETVDVDKETRVVEELEVGKTATTDTAHVEETVRREEFDIDDETGTARRDR